MNKPISGVASLLASFLAISAPWLAVTTPTGGGEQGFGLYLLYRFAASIATGLLIGMWGLAVAISLHRRERASLLILIGLGLNVTAAGWCISWWLQR